MKKEKKPHRNMVLLVCVDVMKDNQIKGRVFSSWLREAIRFNDIGHLLMQMEDLFDRQDYPKAFQRKRTFGEKSESKRPIPTESSCVDEAWELDQKGQVFSFEVYVTARQNTTWQGWVDWLDGSPRQHFESALELIRLTNQAMERGQGEQ